MPGETYSSYASNLRLVQKRSFKDSISKGGKRASAAIKSVSLFAYIDPFIDWLFGIALILAMLKDLLDIINTVLIAVFGIGEILTIIFTFFISVFIFLIMVITGSTGKVKMARSIIKRTLLLIGTAITEMIPAVGMLPLETVLVVVAFVMTLAERKKAEQGNKK
ncbi:MAG TPA: hypothetical protein DIC35_03330 [Candidatus Moranbacteria bacterium]|nr:hypothetical protein [Candidatus Moranbacteria bacterium]